MTRIAIIGGGVAAHTVVKSLLAAGGTPADLTVDVFSTESHAPYRRPAVNKEILLEGRTPADVALPGTVLEAPGVTLRLNTTVTSVTVTDAGTGTLTAGNVTYPFDSLVFATGAGPRLLQDEWLDGRDVHYVRTPEHSTALREKLTALGPDQTVAVIGGGVLGLEAAAAAAVLSDARVHVLELADEVCSRILPPTASRWLRDRHHEQGVTVTCGVDAGALPAEIDRLDPAAIIISVGAVRDTMLAEDAGFTVGDGVGGGIIVDTFGRTGVPGVYAVGDCAEIHCDDGRVLRPEDEGSARTLAGIVGALLGGAGAGGAGAEDGTVASFTDSPQKGWTRQYGHMLNILGSTGVHADHPGTAGFAEHVLLDTGEELVVYTVDDRDTVVGVTTVGRSPEVRSARNALGTVFAR